MWQTEHHRSRDAEIRPLLTGRVLVVVVICTQLLRLSSAAINFDTYPVRCDLPAKLIARWLASPDHNPCHSVKTLRTATVHACSGTLRPGSRNTIPRYPLQ